MNVAVVQARMSSTRLPGKMMFPLAGRHVITHVVRRVAAADSVDTVVVATSTGRSDNVIDQYASAAGADVSRGAEEDVLGRMYDAVAAYDPSVVVRIAGDRPLVPPACIDAVVERLHETGVDYAANVLERTFPHGFEAEAFTFESFGAVEAASTEPEQREHVTPYYRSNPDEFTRANVTSDTVFDDPALHDRTDLRLTLDEASDYELLETVYENVSFDHILPVEDAVAYIDETGIADLNAAVEQRTL